MRLKSGYYTQAVVLALRDFLTPVSNSTAETCNNAPLAFRLALLCSSALGLGRLPIAPGTWGSLGGIAVYVLLGWSLPLWGGEGWGPGSQRWLIALAVAIVALSLVGVWTATVVAAQLKKADPGVVVIDEIAGQLIALLPLASLDWRWLLATFLLFRLFDIWKPFPARQVEAWRGGWGIMADDWIAGLYVAALLGIARKLLL